ncbi:MAG: D-glycero-beta-D-manno-heptose-7-phosphate kinase [Bacteroidetes bacterium]|nr:D-glycero-beta-D-manno-heptose-7-phosphate kinase [Bacteroidota bacterium]
MAAKSKYTDLLEDFSKLKVLILGDVMIDAYLWGKVERISPEAPVPIVAVHKREERLGGAANVALNVKSLGAVPILCSVIGNDIKGDLFIKLLEKEGMDTTGIIKSSGRVTTTKFRIIGNNSQMLRVDEESTTELNAADTTSIVTVIKDILKQHKIDVLIFQDYNKGILTQKVIRKVIEMATESNIPVAVDPKIQNFSAYKGITLFKPNLKELKEGLKYDFNHRDIKELNQVVQKLQEKQQIQHALITMSEDGIYISSREGNQRYIHSIPAHRRSIADVSGAGDTVISVAALCLASRCMPYEIAAISNLAGGIVCEEIGVVPVKREKLMAELVRLNNL